MQQFDSRGTLIEIGPGFSDKLAFGLAALDFRGRVILVEPNEAAARWALARYRRLLPEAKVVVSRRPVPVSTVLDGYNVDAVVSNHILDDLLLNAAVSRATSTKLFSEMCPDLACSSLFVESWKRMLAAPVQLETLVTRVIEDLMNYLDSVQPRFVALNHYLSWRHAESGLDSIHIQALRMIRKLQERFGAGCISYTDSIDVGQRGTICWLVRWR